MGRDWYRGGSGAKTSSTSSGCFNTIFHLFDFHFLTNQTSTASMSLGSRTSTRSCFKHEPDSFMLKGAEAPRNSLESEDKVSTSAEAEVSASLTSTSKENENLNIAIGIRIKTSRVGVTDNETCSSPGTKTPTLVARLMGLDILPEESLSNSSTPPNLKPLRTKMTSHRKSLDGDMRGRRTGTRSLPETPRVSSARRSDSDLDIHRCHRQRLINKENMSPTSEELVKQVKESVGRKLGTDITNTVRNRDEVVASQFKHNKHSKLADDSTASPSPKLRFLDSNKSKPLNLQQPVEEEQDQEHHKQQQQKISESATASRFKKVSGASRLKRPQRTSDIIRNKQEEPFVRPSMDKKCKKIPLSNHLLNISVKKGHSFPPTKIPQKQVLDAQKPKHNSRLSSCSSLMYYNKQEGTNIHLVRDDKVRDKYNDVTTTTTTTVAISDTEAEYEYIVRILRRIGIDKRTPLSSITWFSPSHPLDPSIFYYLEHVTTCSTQLRHRCNRKLMFRLVDEILVDILKPMKPINGSQLIDMLCSKSRRFPRADCRVLEDIDGLIEQDLVEMKDQIVKSYEEEGDGIVAEIEKDVIEALVHETVSDFGVRD